MIARITFAVALYAGSTLAWAQAPAPPAETDQALRARVTTFLQGFVDKKYRQLLPLVADDTQDEFFAMGKAELKSFKIDTIEYTGDFTKATVKTSIVKIWRWEGYELFPQAELSLTWKIENGNWVWYHDQASDNHITPMGASDLSKLVKDNKGGAPAELPKISQNTIDATALTLMRQATLDKPKVTLAADKASSETVTVKNGASGRVDLSLESVPPVPGLKVTLDKGSVNANETATVQVSYDPPAGTKPADLRPLDFAVLVSPFNQRLMVQVAFGEAK